MLPENKQIKIPEILTRIAPQEVAKISRYNAGKTTRNDLLKVVPNVVGAAWKGTGLYRRDNLFECKECMTHEFEIDEMQVQGHFKYYSQFLKEFAEHFEKQHSDWEEWHRQNYAKLIQAREKARQTEETMRIVKRFTSQSESEYECSVKLSKLLQEAQATQHNTSGVFGQGRESVTITMTPDYDLDNVYRYAIAITSHLSDVPIAEKTVESIGIDQYSAEQYEKCLRKQTDVIVEQLLAKYPLDPKRFKESKAEIRYSVEERLYELSPRETVSELVERVYSDLIQDAEIYEEEDEIQVLAK